MGLIKAGIGALGGTLADQWKEFFYCESLSSDVLLTKGVKQTTSRSTNTRGNDNVISNGSGIAVADGQCMIIVEQGKIVEFCAEPGEFTYNSSSEPSIFTGKLGDSIKESFKILGKRFTLGGDTGKAQYVYYFNTKEIMDNKFGTATPISFRVVDRNINLDTDMSLRCNGVFSYRISDPIRFYTNISGNVTDEYRREEIDTQLKTEFISKLQPALAKLSALEIRPNQLISHTTELEQAMNEILSVDWGEKRGLQIVNVAFGTVTLTDEDAKLLKDLKTASNPSLAAARLAAARAQAMTDAAKNEGGAMNGFIGMGMAMNSGGGGSDLQNLYAMGNAMNNAAQAAQPAADSWKCSCGTVNTGKFCQNCGSPKPAPAEGWTCGCGAVNQGKFCQNCGKPKPAGAPLYRCDKCGWTPEDPHNPPKFCPECGDVFDENDRT